MGTGSRSQIVRTRGDEESKGMRRYKGTDRALFLLYPPIIPLESLIYCLRLHTEDTKIPLLSYLLATNSRTSRFTLANEV